MSKSLSHIPLVTHIFFCACLADPDGGEAARINGSMLRNFFEALVMSGRMRGLKRIRPDLRAQAIRRAPRATEEPNARR